jgi:hypothetical protein
MIMRKKKTPTRNDIPDPRRVHALSVYDGQDFVGSIVEHDDVYFAFGTDDVLVGEFTTERAAIHALPAAKVSS